MKQLPAVAAERRTVGAGSQNIELRHLRYFVAVAEAGSFTDAAEQMFMAQPTLSQQLRRLEGIVGTRLLHRRREGLRLTAAGTILLETSRTVLSLVDHGVNHARQSAGLARQRLRMVVPPCLPDLLAVETMSRLKCAAGAAGIDVTWLEAVLDCEFSLVQQHKADAALGWLAGPADRLDDPLDVMSLGEFEPELWVPSWHPAAHRGSVTIGEMAEMDVLYGPRRAAAGPYDAWTGVLRRVNPQFAFADPPFRHSLAICLAIAATASRPTAVLSGPAIATGSDPAMAMHPRASGIPDMVAVTVHHHLLTATAGLVWNTDLPRQLQQILFDTADTLSVPAAKAS